jgi:hypothetical protein
VDITSLVTELQLRGFSQDKVDTAFRCLVHVHSVQDFASEEKGGILVEDVLDNYPIEVVQAASELFLEKGKSGEHQVFRVRWGCEDAARTMEGQLWDYSSARWNEFVSGLNDRYLGFFLPSSDAARVINNWKLRKDLKWFSIAMPRHGWNILRLIDDVAAVAWRLDLAFGFRPYGATGVQGERTLLHEKAYAALQQKAVSPPEELRAAIRLWKFFTEYNVQSTNFEALMKECGLTLDEVAGQVDRFFEKNLTSRYREGQYPPYFVNDKRKKEFQFEVRRLLAPMDAWLARTELASGEPPEDQADANKVAAQKSGGPVTRLAQLLATRGSR